MFLFIDLGIYVFFFSKLFIYLKLCINKIGIIGEEEGWVCREDEK